VFKVIVLLNGEFISQVSGGQQTEQGFPLGSCLCLAHPIYFYPEKLLSLADVKHTQNMMQPSSCLKIRRQLLSDDVDFPQT
jgi:hypothetical protein